MKKSKNKMRMKEKNVLLKHFLQTIVILFATAIFIIFNDQKCMATNLIKCIDKSEMNSVKLHITGINEEKFKRSKKSDDEKNQMEFSEEDVEILARIIYAEIGEYINEPDAEIGFKLTGTTVINRVNSEICPNTIRGVLYQEGQYAERTKRLVEEKSQEVPEIVYQWAREVLEGDLVGPANMVYQDTKPHGDDVYTQYLDMYFCITNLIPVE